MMTDEFMHELADAEDVMAGFLFRLIAIFIRDDAGMSQLLLERVVEIPETAFYIALLMTSLT